MSNYTNAPQPLARLTGRDGSTDSDTILAPAQAREALFDLQAWATARRYRINYDESFRAEADPSVRADGRDYAEVPGERGTLYALGPDTVGAWTSTRGVLAELLALGPAVVIHQRGDLEAVVRFPSRLLEAVAGIIRPRRRRTLDPERARAIGANTAFAGAQVREEALERNGEAADGSDIGVRE